jgi:hypothetical protein
MSPLDWLAVPAVVTAAAAVAVWAAGRTSATGLSQDQRAAKLRAGLERAAPTAGSGTHDGGRPE